MYAHACTLSLGRAATLAFPTCAARLEHAGKLVASHGRKQRSFAAACEWFITVVAGCTESIGRTRGCLEQNLSLIHI